MWKLFGRLAVIFFLAMGVYYLREFRGNSSEPIVTTEEAIEIANVKQPVALDFGNESNSASKNTTAVIPNYQQPTAEIKTVVAAEKLVMTTPLTQVKVFLYEWGIDVSTKTVPAGDVLFYVENNGKFSHEFAIEGVRDFGKVIPGEGAIFRLNGMAKGNYTLVSPKSVDQERGMRQNFSAQ